MIKSSVTISLVPEAKGGPFVLWDDLAKSCCTAAAAKFDAVEIFALNAKAIDRVAVADILNKNNLKLAALGTGAGFVFGGLYLCEPDAHKRRKAREFVAEIVELAGSFGAVAIIGSMQGKIPKTIDREQAEQWLREELNQLGPLAQKYGVPLILEPLNRFETNFFNRLDQGVEMIKSLDTDNVKLLADMFHMNIEEQSIGEAIRTAAEHIGHVHFVDSNRRPVGFGHIDIAEVIDALKEIGYNGYLSAEAMAYPNPEKAAEQTMEVFNKYIK